MMDLWVMSDLHEADEYGAEVGWQLRAADARPAAFQVAGARPAVCPYLTPSPEARGPPVPAKQHVHTLHYHVSDVYSHVAPGCAPSCSS